MSYVFVINGVWKQIDVALPVRSRRINTDGMEVLVREGTLADQEACGFYKITTVTPPSISDNQRLERTVEFINGSWTEVWTVRQETSEENTTRVRNDNLTTLRSQAETGLNMLQAIIDDTNVTNADAVNYIKDQARILRKVIRMQLNKLDGVD